MSDGMKRRQFLRDSVASVSALAAGLADGAREADMMAGGVGEAAEPEKIGRPVRVVSIGFHPGRSLHEIVSLVDHEGKEGADLVVLPETCRGQNETSAETLSGPTVSAMARLATKHKTYIVCPIDRMERGRRFNSAVLLDRTGKVVCFYDKIYPVWKDECLLKPPVHPGTAVKVYQADFGRVGFATCFDVNWTNLWEQLANQGAELVVWPSAYSAGRALGALATRYNYYIVSATHIPDCFVFDLDGQQVVHDTNNRNDGTNITRITLDLDRGIFDLAYNYPGRLDRLLKEHGEDVLQEKMMPLEGWFILKARRPGVSARELARQYGIEELRHYINRSRCEIDKCRGWEFS